MVGTLQNDFFFIFSLSRSFPTNFGLKKAIIVFSLIFLKFFAIFLKLSITCRVRTHRNTFFLFSLFLGPPQRILARKEAIIVFSNFLNIFAIFTEFPIAGLVGTRRNEFSFPSFSAFPNLFWLEKKPQRCFLIF